MRCTDYLDVIFYLHFEAGLLFGVALAHNLIDVPLAPIFELAQLHDRID